MVSSSRFHTQKQESKQDICIALYSEYDSSLRRSGTARVNEESHSFTYHPAEHAYKMEVVMPAFTPITIIALWPVLISRPAEGSRLSWPT